MRLAVILLAISAAFAADANEPIWPQWRGPDRNCQVASRQWPPGLSHDRLTQTFRVPLGDSYSGPIVTEKMVYVTETIGPNEVVRALDRATGNEFWKVEWKGAMTVPFFAAANGSWIRSTPAYADGRLYVASMEDVMFALDAGTGRQLWRTDFRTEFGTGNQSFGFACSPLVDADHVFVQTGAGLVKLSGETGSVVWRSLTEDGGMMGGAFSSPVVAEIGGVRQLVVQTRSKLAGVALDNGNELWSISVPAFRGMNILTPTVIGDQVFTSSYGGGSFMFRVSRNGSRFTVSKVWEGKNEAYMSSPVVVDGHIYVHLRNQRFACLDPNTGKPLWTTKPFGKYWSMAANGNRVLALDERGDLLLLDLNTREFVQMDTRHVSDATTWAHLAVAGNQIFVRELNGLLAFEWN